MSPKFSFQKRVFLITGIIVTVVLTVFSVSQIKHADRAANYWRYRSATEPSHAPFNMITVDKQTATTEHLPNAITKIAFVRDEAVHLYDVSTKQVTRIAEGYDPDISRKGDTIVFTVNLDDPGPNTTIKLFRLHSGAIVDFPSLSGFNVRQGRWSHDGTRVAFQVIVDNRSHIGVLEVSSGRWYDLTRVFVFSGESGVYGASWSADDESIVCHDLSTIYEISLNGTVINRIPIGTIVPRGEVASSLRFQYSADRKLLLFNGALHPENTAIYLFSVPDRALHLLTPRNMDGSEPVWLPSGNGIMFSCAYDTTGAASDICVMSLSDRKITRVIRNGSSGSYSVR
jgi:Tol biopolymer transport system component